MSRLPGRSPLPSVTLTRVAARRPSRTIDRSAYPHVNGGTRDPPDLGAIPDAFRSLRPGREAGFLSWGCPKIAPPSFKPRSPSPGRTHPLAPVLTPVARGLIPPSEWERRFPLAFRPRGFSPPRRFAPPRPCDRISGRCRSWGSPRFLPLRNGIPRDVPTALRSLPSADSYGTPGRIPCSRGPASPSRPFPTAPSPQTLPPHPFPLTRSPAVTRRLPDESRGLEALLHRRVRCAPCRCQPYAPGAPLGLADLPVPPA